MKSNFEHGDHTAIRRVKELLVEEARVLFNWDVRASISTRMWQLVWGNTVGSELLVRLIKGNLTGSERKKIREMAGLREPTTPPEDFFFPKKK